MIDVVINTILVHNLVSRNSTE